MKTFKLWPWNCPVVLQHVLKLVSSKRRNDKTDNPLYYNTIQTPEPCRGIFKIQAERSDRQLVEGVERNSDEKFAPESIQPVCLPATLSNSCSRIDMPEPRLRFGK